MRCICFWPLLPAAALLSGCAAPAPEQSHARSFLPPESYLRVDCSDSNVVQLQIAVRGFVPARGKGPSVWLAGASHIGESNYYAALQRKLDVQTLVLFEGVSGGGEARAPTESQGTPPDGSAESVSNSGKSHAALQLSMAASLGLVFQLDAINYDRPNFRNCDLSIQQLRHLLDQQRPASGEPSPGESFEGLLQMMEGSSWLDSLLQVALRFLGSNPKLQALGRLVLIDTLSQIQGDPSQLRGLSPNLTSLLEALLQRRNEKVIAELKSQLPRLGRHSSVAVFYGTGHMLDLETRLRKELNYRPSEQFWLTAFSVDLKRAGVSPAERQFIDSLVKSQLDQVLPRKGT